MRQNRTCLDVFKRSRGLFSTTIAFGFFGFLVAIIYIYTSPKKYEAITQVKMAQISISNPANPFGVNIEEPASLIARMQSPTNYSQIVIDACGFQGQPEAPLALSRSLKFKSPKGLSNSVEFRLLANSPAEAKECAQAVFQQIALLQSQFAKPFLEEAKIRLAQDNQRIEAAKLVIAKADQSGDAMSAAFLSARDEITYFLTDREKMIDLINSADNRGTSLVSPIYVTDTPVTPKKLMTLLVGLLGGGILGLTIFSFRKFLAAKKRRES